MQFFLFFLFISVGILLAVARTLIPQRLGSGYTPSVMEHGAPRWPHLRVIWVATDSKLLWYLYVQLSLLHLPYGRSLNGLCGFIQCLGTGCLKNLHVIRLSIDWLNNQLVLEKKLVVSSGEDLRNYSEHQFIFLICFVYLYSCFKNLKHCYVIVKKCHMFYHFTDDLTYWVFRSLF